jgi:hypothetical protein
MRFRSAAFFCATAIFATYVSPAWSADPPSDASPAGEKTSAQAKVSVGVARDRAKLLHSVYLSTLEVMHERYFHDEKAIIPARAMEDVFAELSRQSQIDARWIAVNTKAMGVRHEPKSDFEKQAAAQLSAGKEELELIEQGRYYRATAIPLTAGCVSCHTNFFTTIPKTPRFAGLVITMPVSDE